MAAIRPDGITTGTAPGTDYAGDFGTVAGGLKHIVVPFLTQLVDNADTYDPGSGSAGGNTSIGIARVAWEPETVDDEVAVTITNTGGQVTFNAAADNLNGTLHMWIAG